MKAIHLFVAILIVLVLVSCTAAPITRGTAMTISKPTEIPKKPNPINTLTSTIIRTSTPTPTLTTTPTITPDPIPPDITNMGLFMWKLARDLGVSLVVAEADETGEFFCPPNYQQDMYVFQDNGVSKLYATALMEGFLTQEDPAGFLAISSVFGYDITVQQYKPQVGLGFSLYDGDIPSDCWGYYPGGNNLEVCMYDRYRTISMYLTNQNGPGEIYGLIVAYPLNSDQLSILKDMYSFQNYPSLYIIESTMEYHCP